MTEKDLKIQEQRAEINRLKEDNAKLKNCKSCRADCTGIGKEGDASNCTYFTEEGSRLPRPWISVDERLPKTHEWMNKEECPEFIVAIKWAEEATGLRYRPDIGWFDENGNTYVVTAWCPYPELP